MTNKLGYLAAGLMVAGMIALAPAPALAGCGACGPKEKAACAEDCAKDCCAKKSECGEKKASDAGCSKKACCAKEEAKGDGV